MQRPLTILLVDDEPRVLRSYRRHLSSPVVVGLASVQAVGQWLDGGGRPDVVISDFSLEDGTGLDVLHRVAAVALDAECYIASANVSAVLDEAESLCTAVLAKNSPELIELLVDLNGRVTREHAQLAQRMQDVDLSTTLVPDDDATPNWYGAAEQELVDEENPATVEVWRRLRSSGPLHAHWQDASACVDGFQAALPESLVPAYLEADRLHLAKRSVESTLAYNVGVDDGRRMNAVEAALREAGAVVGAVDTRALFRVTLAIVTVARQIAGLR